MESFIPISGLQMPSFQRRLSRLYNDTKKSSDFMKEPVRHAEAADPEIKVLHRKLRIQKDRLVSWGLEWSDPNQSAEILIDSSLSKAGLSEVVGSIMSTIKDILAEAEPLWHSSRRLAGEHLEPESLPKGGEKIQLVVWDKNKFEDLIRDLTTSIDTLYDLSRTRSSSAQSSAAARERLFKSAASAEDLRPFESSRMQTPQQIDPNSLTNLRSMQAEPMTEIDHEERPREIVFMSKQAYSKLTHTSASGRQPYAPLLLEYASFDTIYSTTGIGPPMTRFEKLSTGLQRESERSPGSWIGLPRLLGYFDDMENSRLGLVYRFPPTFNPVTFEHLTQNPLYNLCSLADLLARPDFEPKLEAKFRLASNLTNTVFDMQARGIVHGRLVSANVSFCNAVGTDPEVSGMTTGEVDIRRPLVSSFDLFSEPGAQREVSSFSLYKHPLDPRNTFQSPLATHSDSKTFDLYSLAMVLLSIGLWTKLENLVPKEASAIPESVLDQLAIRCGTLFMKAVQTCWNAVDQEIANQATSDQIVARAQRRATRYLEACCILDGVSNLEERLSDDLGETQQQASHVPAFIAGSSTESQPENPHHAVSGNIASAGLERGVPLTSPGQDNGRGRSETEVQDVAETQPKEPSAKTTRLYPHVPLPPEAVEHWNRTLMPQVNTALRHFYHKSVESVEISLESIGESPQRTIPTVLVVCTSVSKVRAILKKKLGVFFDGPTGFALKVCRGQVLRSRNQRVDRSMAKGGQDDSETTAANSGYQVRPQNGASIGVWIGDRHLPPVSFGGLIMVDNKAYGMTVHHMLDDPDQNDGTATTKEEAPRSMARQQGLPDLAAWYAEQYQHNESETESNGTEDYVCDFSDSDSATSESAITSETSDEELEEGEEEGKFQEIGDIPGVEPGCGDGYIVTQPALDDVDESFYVSAETRNEEHIDSFRLGEVYATSGIRRRHDVNGMLHEIDWALFEFQDERQPDSNMIPSVVKPQPTPPGPGIIKRVICPTTVASTAELPGRTVQCMARTSGLQTGLILPQLVSVKIKGRKSPSQTYEVAGTSRGAVTSTLTNDDNKEPDAGALGNSSLRLPMGVPGDSGAWVVDQGAGKLCGHVLAWSERKRVAYICPMDVLLEDIAETLEACDIRLPGGQALLGCDGGDSTRYNQAYGKRISQITEVGDKDSLHGWDGGDEEDEDLPSSLFSSSSYRRSGSQRSTTTTVQRASSFQSRSGLWRSSGAQLKLMNQGDSCDEALETKIANDIEKMQLGWA